MADQEDEDEFQFDPVSCIHCGSEEYRLVAQSGPGVTARCANCDNPLGTFTSLGGINL